MARKKSQGMTTTGYGLTEAAAEEDLRLKLLADLQIALELPTKPTLHDYAVACWEPQIRHLAPGTQKRYVGAYVHHIRDYLGTMPIDEIKRSDVQDWINGFVARNPNSAASARFTSTLLGTILRMAENDDVVARSPHRGIKVPKKPVKRERTLQVEEALAVLEACDKTPISAPVYLSMVLGLRLGELSGLRWSDLDRQKGELRIQRQRQGVTRVGVVERELKTTGSRRILHLPQSIIDGIDRRGDLDSEYICTYKMEPWIPDTISEFWKARREGLGLPNWHFHDLRHLAAGLLNAAGADLMQIAAVLGHAKPDMSVLYTSITQKQAKDALVKLEAFMKF